MFASDSSQFSNNLQTDFADYTPGFASPDFNINFNTAGTLYKASPINQPQPNSIENLTFDYINKSKQVSDGIRLQHQIDNVYEQVMQTAPSRDVEVLPPEDPAASFDANTPRLKNITPLDQQQEIADLLQRQIKTQQPPTTGTPPQSFDTTGARPGPLTDPQVTPTTASPRTAIPGPDPSPEALPSSLPSPSARLAGPLVGGLVNFGFRVVSGQDPGQAAFNSGGQVAGGIIGGGLGSLAGPAGSFAGSLVGGFIGGALADVVYAGAFPSTGSTNPDPFLAPPPFEGGQRATAYNWNFSTIANPRSHYLNNLAFQATGPISNFKVVALLNTDTIGGVKYGNWQAQFEANGQIAQGTAVGFYPNDLPNLVVYPADSLPDQSLPGGTPPADNRSPESRLHPGNQDFAPPSAYPSQTGAPNNYAPGGINTTSPSGKSYVPPSGFPNAKNSAPPNSLGSDFPTPSPAPTPASNPSLNPTPASSPNLNPTSAPSPSPQNYKIYGPSYTPGNSNTGGSVVGGQPSTNSRISLGSPGSYPTSIPTTSKTNPPDTKASPTPPPTINQIQNQNNNLLLAQIATIVQQNKCPNPPDVVCYAAVPEWWQVRLEGNRPQLVILCAEKQGGKVTGDSKYAITIPHPNPDKNFYAVSPIPDYQKGQWEGIITLKDNSKIIINCFSTQVAQLVLDAAKKIVVPEYAAKARQKIGERQGVELLKIVVSPRKAAYFSTGLTSTIPDWEVLFP